MSDQSPYKTLGVPESASFEDIQEARDRLISECSDDRQQREQIETAYDSILMERLRLRQEGKIKVPDRIRFPEKLLQPPPAPVAEPPKQSPAWLQRLLDTPSRADVLWPAGLLAVLGGAVVLYPTEAVLQLAMVLGVGVSFYFLYRKERKLGRSVLLGLGGLILGFLLGGLLDAGFRGALLNLGLVTEVFVSVFTFFILWLVSSFLR